MLIPARSPSQDAQTHPFGATFDVSNETRRDSNAFGESTRAMCFNEFRQLHPVMLPQEARNVKTFDASGNVFPFPEESSTLPSMTPDDLPELMKKWRETNKFSQREAAKRAGIHYSYWSKLESGTAEAKALVRMQLHRVIGVDPTAEVRETAAIYGWPDAIDVELAQRDIDAIATLIGPAQVGDRLLFQPVEAVETAGVIVLVGLDNRKAIGVSARNPMTNKLVVWITETANPVAMSDAHLIGVAKMLVRRLNLES
jgi:transcriptional regulator with XRE-family HTH domain